MELATILKKFDVITNQDTCDLLFIDEALLLCC